MFYVLKDVLKWHAQISYWNPFKEKNKIITVKIIIFIYFLKFENQNI